MKKNTLAFAIVDFKYTYKTHINLGVIYVMTIILIKKQIKKQVNFTVKSNASQTVCGPGFSWN